MNHSEMIEQIITYVKDTVQNPDMDRVSKELSILESTYGINEKNNLESFYNTWIDYKDGLLEHSEEDCNDINSLTGYYLGLTSIEPDGEFMHPRRVFARPSPPDVDIDYDDEGRDYIFEYLIKKYGEEYASKIGTYGTLKTRSVLTRVIKALDVSNSFHKGKDAYITDNNNKATEILKSLPDTTSGKMVVKDGDETIILKSVDDAYKYVPSFRFYMDSHPEVYNHAKRIEGLTSNYSVHASGIVISNEPLVNLVPLRSDNKGGLATQFPYEDLESIGLIKFDMLAIATWTVVKKALALIKENYGIDVDYRRLPLNDNKVFDLYRKGHLAGVFQCGSYGMQKTMKEIAVDSFHDISAAIALFRPGPMESIPRYCARKRGEEKIDYFHPSVEKYVKPYLESTYGVLVYQEQIMQICNSLAGLTPFDGYMIIKGIGKKKDYIIERCKKMFVNGAIETNGIERGVIEQYWDKFIVPFAQYGFNMAHSVSYAYFSYITAYLKAHYPEEFMTSLLNVNIERAKHDKAMDYEKELKKMGIKLQKRSVNTCKPLYYIACKKDTNSGISSSEITPALICKGVGMEAATNIADNQPYKNIEEFAVKTNHTIVDKEVLSYLIDGGYFSGNKGIKEKDSIISKFVAIREDLKSAKKKGVPFVDMFE